HRGRAVAGRAEQRLQVQPHHVYAVPIVGTQQKRVRDLPVIVPRTATLFPHRAQPGDADPVHRQGWRAGLRAVWEERGGTWHEDWQVTHPFLLRPDDRHGIDMMRLYLEPLFRSPGDRPTAVFAAHDEMAIVAIRALEEMGLSVPRDVSVVGFNDSGTLAAFFRPALTTVRTPSAALATLAVHQLADLMRRPEDRPRSIRLPPEIIVRESTGPAASAAAPSTRR
ncbi:MAG TPA: substrate-binding domain-containing protein, partial [Armatimonadaceae bacterium]|nr:substrate-binding domain-containing protein [Armatimonadaceae bacterium]